jgi:hypothetical protein
LDARAGAGLSLPETLITHFKIQWGQQSLYVCNYASTFSHNISTREVHSGVYSFSRQRLTALLPSFFQLRRQRLVCLLVEIETEIKNFIGSACGVSKESDP